MTEARAITQETFTLAENPLWDDRRECLFFTDIDEGRTYQLDPDGELDEIYSGPKVGGFTLQDTGDLLLFRETDVVILDPERGAITPVATYTKPGVSRFNDVIACPDHSVLAGTLGPEGTKAGLIHLATDGTITELWDGTGISNGMAFTADGKTLYWTDSTHRRVDAIDVDPAKPFAACLSNRRPALQLEDPADGVPDGMTIDAEGMVWQARWGAACVVRLDPNDGWRERQRVDVPAANVTSVAFFGVDTPMLFITTAEGPVYVVEAGVCGRPEFRSRIASG